MDIRTKFNLGELVYAVSCETFPRTTTCPVCNGKRTVIDGFDVTCKTCHDTSYLIDGKITKYRVETSGVIGKIEASVYSNDKNTPVYLRGDSSIGYMITATGVGIGTVWSEERLFHSKEEAEAFCKMKNQLEEQEDK